MFNIYITATAEQDIRQATDWWSENRSAAQAATWYKNIFLSIDTLQEMPKRCPVAKESIKYKLPLHQLLFGTGRQTTHRILFDVHENDVRIWRVLHTSQDETDPLFPE